MFGLILAVSLGVGYSAVYLADSMNKSPLEDDSSGLGALSKMAGGGAAGALGNLSDDQKKALLKQLQSGGGD
jgi:hypothetical protein